MRVEHSHVAAWQFLTQPRSLESFVPQTLRSLIAQTRELIALAVEHRLFFARTPWLMGWKQGLPGGMCTNLLAALDAACNTPPSRAALSFWQEYEPEVRELARTFFVRAEGYLLAARLADTLLVSMPNAVDKASLAKERDQLFGHPMLGKGILGRILSLVEEYFYLCVEAADSPETEDSALF